MSAINLLSGGNIAAQYTRELTVSTINGVPAGGGGGGNTLTVGSQTGDQVFISAIPGQNIGLNSSAIEDQAFVNLNWNNSNLSTIAYASFATDLSGSQAYINYNTVDLAGNATQQGQISFYSTVQGFTGGGIVLGDSTGPVASVADSKLTANIVDVLNTLKVQGAPVLPYAPQLIPYQATALAAGATAAITGWLPVNADGVNKYRLAGVLGVSSGTTTASLTTVEVQGDPGGILCDFLTLRNDHLSYTNGPPGGQYVEVPFSLEFVPQQGDSNVRLSATNYDPALTTEIVVDSPGNGYFSTCSLTLLGAKN